MSLQFSNTTTKAGVIQHIEQSCGFDDGGITGNTVLMAQFTGKVNVAQDDVLAEALRNKGWKIGDFNHTKDPFITIDLVSGQRDYHFSTDQEGSLILGILKVMVKNSSGIYVEMESVDMYGENTEDFWDGNDTTGMPTRYSKKDNGIFFDIIPVTGSVTLSAGIKVFIDRESTYFATTDTTKVSGIDGLCHDYLYLKPSYEYARDKGLQNRESLFRDMQVAWKKIEQRYASVNKDENNVMTVKKINYI